MLNTQPSNGCVFHSDRGNQYSRLVANNKFAHFSLCVKREFQAKMVSTLNNLY